MRPTKHRFTKRLCVRDFEPQDAAAIYQLSREAGMRRFIPDQVYRDEEHARSVLEFLIEQYADPSAIKTGTFVQAVALHGSPGASLLPPHAYREFLQGFGSIQFFKAWLSEREQVDAVRGIAGRVTWGRASGAVALH